MSLIGPTGLDAVVVPPSATNRGEHLMFYRYDDRAQRVRFTMNRSEIDAERHWGQTSVESFLENGPIRDAVDDLSSAFSRLVSISGIRR
jgi:hypothetical protein